MTLQRKKPTQKDCILHDSIYIIFLKWENCRIWEQIRVSRGQEGHKNIGEVGVAIEGYHIDRNVLYLDYVDTNIHNGIVV